MGEFLSDHRILFVRHPETMANLEGRLVGRSDSPYSDRGHEQAQAVVHYLEQHSIDSVYTSPLKRAKNLAGLIADSHGLAAEVDGRLQEIDFGSAEGLLYADLPRHGISIDYDSYAKPIVLGGESRVDVDRRVADFLRSLGSKPGVSCVISHGGPMRSAVTTLLGLRPTDCWAFHIANGAVLTISLCGGRGILEDVRVIG